MHAKLYRSDEDDAQLELGRYRVVDMEASKPGSPAIRMVDTRTVTEVVAEGIRYYTSIPPPSPTSFKGSLIWLASSF